MTILAGLNGSSAVRPGVSAAARRDLTVMPLEDSTRWDEFVPRAAGNSFCHLAGWRDIVSDVLGAECLFRVATDRNGEWQGVLPLVRVKSRLFGHYLVSMPFLNYGGPLGSAAACRRLVDEALAEARRSRADLLELRTPVKADLGLPVSERKLTVLLDLPPSPKQLWDAFPSKLRSQIRRPMKEGLGTRFGVDQLEPFYHLWTRNMRDLGTPVLPRAWFERIAATFPDLVVFGATYRSGGGEPLAAGCGFVWDGEFELNWAASLRRDARLAPNMWLYWSFMYEMIRRGAHRFNFGRCTPGGGTHRFKQQWGGGDVALPWCEYAPGERTATPSPKDPAFSWGPRVWRRLPLPIANRLGPRVSRYLP